MFCKCEPRIYNIGKRGLVFFCSGVFLASCVAVLSNRQALATSEERSKKDKYYNNGVLAVAFFCQVWETFSNPNQLTCECNDGDLMTFRAGLVGMSLICNSRRNRWPWIARVESFLEPRHPKPATLTPNQKPQTPNPKPQPLTPNPKPKTPNLKP